MTTPSHLRPLALMAILASVGGMATGQPARAQGEATPAVICKQKALPANAIEANKRLMNRFVDFINTADEKMAEELVSKQAIFYVPGRPDPVKGPEGYIAINAQRLPGHSLETGRSGRRTQQGRCPVHDVWHAQRNLFWRTCHRKADRRSGAEHLSLVRWPDRTGIWSARFTRLDAADRCLASLSGRGLRRA